MAIFECALAMPAPETSLTLHLPRPLRGALAGCSGRDGVASAARQDLHECELGLGADDKIAD